MRPFLPTSRRILGALLAAALVACGSDDPLQSGNGENPRIAFMVGNWQAERFEIVPNDRPADTLDLAEAGAVFTLNVQRSGQYTASLFVPGIGSNATIGILDAQGDKLIFRQTAPVPDEATATYTELAPGRVVFWGPSELDYDGNGSVDPITLEVEIVRR